MPEGDTVYRLARRLDAGLSGRVLRAADLRVPRFATLDLSGARVRETVSRGKHLLTRLDVEGSSLPGPATLHTHLRMDGQWSVLAPGKRLPRHLEPDVRVLLRTDGPTAVALRMPVVEVVPTAEEATVVGHLGPDLLDATTPVDERVRAAVANLRRRPERGLKAALLDQRNLAGLGNLWADELCYLRGHDPWTPVGQVPLEPLVRLAVKLLAFSVSPSGAMQVTTGDTRPGHQHWVSGRAGQPCRRCGTTILVRAEVPGDPEQRRTWWCPHCQR
ncbi:DNA-formamidopyrimidine glycosylase family protein [Kineococcus radiotolerans]|uniref:DNA-(apurinic or apyrimidinic site) lyase n=1 Tax=Kineococcus radiotolerans (strain ATCC BAA-149 / DSM 14245 / SRS30216) TaxID=266940 RepID=A6W4P5_KINRD|nr:DNA-formamidopyrimidine glycosylase family protein [Kineococcus radiotolerans]ABS01784.1 Formamidopyrimidine-DNA glycolase [Kineococcus radiotolerans SRS30216 = ATCC BAA-149]